LDVAKALKSGEEMCAEDFYFAEDWVWGQVF
jgi:hypothetical protein